MYTIEKWNKTDDINGVSPSEFLKSHPSMINNDCVLVKHGQRVMEVHEIDILKEHLRLSPNATFEEVSEAYLASLNKKVDEADLSEDVSKLKKEQEQQNEEILVNMMANTEMFEMILGMMPVQVNTNSKSANPMINVYVTLYEKGLKDIDDVPLVIREQFIERLNELNIPLR